MSSSISEDDFSAVVHETATTSSISSPSVLVFPCHMALLKSIIAFNLSGISAKIIPKVTAQVDCRKMFFDCYLNKRIVFMNRSREGVICRSHRDLKKTQSNSEKN